MERCNNCGAPFDARPASGSCEFCGAAPARAYKVLAQSLRIEIIDDVSAVLIPKGAQLPTQITEIFSTGQDGQSSVQIHLVEGDAEKASENRHLGRYILPGITPQPKGAPQILFGLSISADGELVVKAEEVGTDNRREYGGVRVGVM